ncbi:molybdopterin oxidoreductase family protein [Bacillus timonensis]|uniref:molybdopterin oxidoreductase family protein n=1 Tax=Bacillus timonensis TaxID=1033734 RepID=UPI0002FFEB94|nr:molybdopterin dinucleotide binding domain-containing protein [Bacillus timonensis]
MYPTYYVPPVEVPRPEYPFWLTTGRLVWQWHTRTKTARSPYLQLIAPEGYVEINIVDAKKLALLPGEMVKIVSPRGSIQVPARIVDTVQPGLVFVPFHYGSWENNQAANELTADYTDPLSKQPTFKQSSCRIEKLRKTVTVTDQVSLNEIASNYGYTLEELARANKMMPPFRADIGDQIEVPLSMKNVDIPPYMPYRNIERLPHFKQADLEVTRMDLEGE